VLGLSASSSGLALIGFMAGTVCGSQVTARLMVRMERYLRIAMIGLAMGVTVLAILASDPAGVSIEKFAILLFVLGCGLGPMYPMSTILMQNAVKPHQLGTATGTLNFFRTLGGAIIVAVFGAIVLGAVADTSGGMTLEKLAVMHGDLAPAYQRVFIAAAIFLGISFCCLFAVEERPLHGPVRLSESPAE
jgi:MFS family permease